MTASPAVAEAGATPTLARDDSKTSSAATLAAEFGTEEDCTDPNADCSPDGNLTITYFYEDPSVCTFNATVDWGDGSTPTHVQDFQDGQQVSHQYADPGIYNVSITGSGLSSDPNVTCNFIPNNFTVEVPEPDPDRDGDGHPDNDDNCPSDANPGQEDLDGDGLGDACDDDNDRDGVRDTIDNCPKVPNPSQADSDDDDIGDACDPYKSRDTDKDGTPDSTDNCMAHKNRSQADSDGDGIGDACDDTVGDGGDTSLDSRRNSNRFTRTAPGPPIILATRAQDTISDRKASVFDLIAIQFNETMHESTGEDGASFRLKDADGTIANVTCGTRAYCELLKGRQKGLPGSPTMKHRQGMAITLLASPEEVESGTVPGLQYPARFESANGSVKDISGQALDLNKSRDRTVEIGPLG